ncbi:MAG: CDP-alcohol phosphatidyltransferase family protein [Prevotella sp.]|jgi:phosphatidylglycerophosphate synthase
MEQNKVKQTYKSNDTEEWLDRVWTRPIGYLWAKFFERLGVSPNTVTVLSMIIGASSAFFFANGSLWTEGWTGFWFNVIAVLLLAWANFYDSADGQLARMTGKKTRLGRILDGAASEVWFIPIYLALVWRFWVHHDRDFNWLGIDDTPEAAIIATLIVLLAVCYSGFVCHSGQCGLADYYRQIHLYFLKGQAGSELDNSKQQQAIYDQTPWEGNRLWKLFLKTYIGYTKKQERQTPNFQRLISLLKERYTSVENFPQELRDEFRRHSLPLMKWTNILTFNTRAIVLYTCCLLDVPLLYFVFEIVIMTALCQWMRHRHESFCKEMTEELMK